MHRFYIRFLKFYFKKFYKHKIKPIKELNFQPKKFLIISHTALGDTLMALPVIKSLKLSFPQSQVIGVFHTKFVSLFENYPYINKVYKYEKKFLSLLTLGQKLKKEKVDVALILHGHFPQDIWIAIKSGAKFILKHRVQEEYKSFLSHQDYLSEGHMIEKKLYLLKLLKAKVISPEMELPLFPNPQIEEKINNFFPKAKKILLGFQLGASHYKRTWPIENFVTLAKILTEKYKNLFFVLFGNKKEVYLAEQFIESYPYQNFVNLVGKLSIKELPYAIKKINLFITPDTGPLHLAIALKVPTISLFGISYPQYTGPFQDPHLHKVIFKPEGLKFRNQKDNIGMKLIKVEEVLRKIEESLKLY